MRRINHNRKILLTSIKKNHISLSYKFYVVMIAPVCEMSNEI